MRSILAEIFRILFRFTIFKKRFFGIHQRIISPLNLFEGVKKRFYFKNSILFDLCIDDWIQENLFFLGEYEAEELIFFENTIKEGDVFVDIGANIGLYTLYASNLVGNNGKVISFEPYGDNFRFLEHNVSLNNKNNIVLEKLAVSRAKKHISIAYDKKDANRGMASTYLKEFSHKELVDSISLDLYFEQKPIDKITFIKIDIEGGEYPALLGMQKTLSKYGPTILIEINKEILSLTPYTEQNIVQYLNQLGYRKYNWKNDLVPLQQMKDNFVFKKNII